MLSLLSLEKEWPKSLKVAHSRQKLSIVSKWNIERQYREAQDSGVGSCLLIPVLLFMISLPSSHINGKGAGPDV